MDRHCRGGFCEKRLGITLIWTDSVPASSEMEPLAEADGSSNTFKKERKNAVQHLWGSEEKISEKSSAITKVSAEGRGGDAAGAGAEIPLQPRVQPMARQQCPCSLGRSRWSRDLQAARPWGIHATVSGYVLKGAAAHAEESLHEQVCWQDL